MTVTIDNKSTVSLTATTTDTRQETLALSYQGTTGTSFMDDNLSTKNSVTLKITSGDSPKIKLSGTYVDNDGNTQDFATNDATTISQDFTAPSDSNTRLNVSFTVTADNGTIVGDPTFILKTKRSL